MITLLKKLLALGVLTLAACGEPKHTPDTLGPAEGPPDVPATVNAGTTEQPPNDMPPGEPGTNETPTPPGSAVTGATEPEPDPVSDPEPDPEPEPTPQPEDPPVVPPVAYPLDDTLRGNQIQARGTHNSYHLRPLTNPYISWQYDMPTLTDQFELLGIRAIELDVHAENGGIAVYHIAVDDPRSTCATLHNCLSELVTWSANHRSHVPIMVFLEVKGAWSSANVTAMDQMIRADVPAHMLFTPDHLMRGRHANVLTAMQSEGWPTLGEMRGKILFTLMAYSPLPSNYTDGGRTLNGRAMFLVASAASSPHIVVLAHDFSVEQEAQIAEAVRQGFLVRTRADTYPGKTNDPGATFRAALRSGAHFILTDFPTGSSYFPDYSSVLPGGVLVRCNPISASADCYAGAVE